MWSRFRLFAAGAVVVRMISTDGVEDEDGELRSKEEREHRGIAETEKNRVTWNVERRHYLDLAACKRSVAVLAAGSGRDCCKINHH